MGRSSCRIANRQEEARGDSRFADLKSLIAPQRGMRLFIFL